MQDLKVISVEDGALLVATEEGTQYRIPIDEAVRSAVRDRPVPDDSPKVAPREIQAQIRSGMSAEEVASVSGASIEYVKKFEGPVVAEREYIVRSALGVTVHTALDPDPAGEGNTFGAVILQRLQALSATDEQWASWKDDALGWVIKLSFVREQVDHDARWGFDPKKLTLAPLNTEARALSQQGEPAGTLIPKLRAVGNDERIPDSSRFDSGVFLFADVHDGDNPPHHAESNRTSSAETLSAAINREPGEPATTLHHTADLLEALRRRRGEREHARFSDEDDYQDVSGAPHGNSGDSGSNHPSGRMRLVDIPLDDFAKDDPLPPTMPQPVVATPKSPKKGRAAIPSWDEIVFGARNDDE